ncbi:MAG: flagellar basal body P-ring protein FlgI [Phycisphaerales bacterium JB065]
MRHTTSSFGRFLATIGACLALLSAAPAVIAQVSDVSIEELTRLQGQGSDEWWGLGLVIGLPNTGDSPDLLPKARMLASLLENAGAAVPDLEEAMAGRSIAVVMVTARLPESSVVKGDRFDVHVQTMFDAKDLTGGRLLLAPLRGAKPGDALVYGYASGLLSSDGSDTPTVARVAKGCRVVQDTRRFVIENGTVTFHVRENYADYTTTSLIADLINQDRQGLRADGAPPIALALDDRSVRVTIPEEEYGNPTRFIAGLQKIRFDQSLLNLEPKITIDERAGVITITGDVIIRPTVITSGNLVVTVIDPAIPATPANPEIRQSNATLISTTADPKSNAQAQSLLEAMRRLEVPVADQIHIFRTLEQNTALSVSINWVGS